MDLPISCVNGVLDQNRMLWRESSNLKFWINFTSELSLPEGGAGVKRHHECLVLKHEQSGVVKLPKLVDLALLGRNGEHLRDGEEEHVEVGDAPEFGVVEHNDEGVFGWGGLLWDGVLFEAGVVFQVVDWVVRAIFYELAYVEDVEDERVANVGEALRCNCWLAFAADRRLVELREICDVQG